MQIFTAIITILLVVIGVAFTLLNANQVEINYFIDKQTLPLAMVLFIAFMVGILLSVIFLGFSIIKLKTKNKWLEKKLNQKLKQSNEQLTHTQPL